MASEHAAIGVQFVDYDIAEILEQASPSGVMRQNSGVQHVRIREHNVPFFTDGFARVARSVAVISENAEAIVQTLIQIVQLGKLILCKRLGREEIQRAVVG